MTNPEFSTQFDILWNNISSDQAPGLNEYEKSVFLTKAQNQLVKEYFNVRTDGVGGGFDGSIGRQYDFSSIIETVTLNQVNPIPQNYVKIHPNGIPYKFKSDVFLIVNETIVDSSNNVYTVVPVSYDEYQRLCRKPYPFPLKREAWRVLTTLGDTTENNIDKKVPIAEVIGRFVEGAIYYKMRYVKNLSPIILENLESYASINSETEETPCVLPEECHHEILERAVTLAKLAWQGNTLTQAQAAQTK